MFDIVFYNDKLTGGNVKVEILTVSAHAVLEQALDDFHLLWLKKWQTQHILKKITSLLKITSLKG